MQELKHAASDADAAAIGAQRAAEIRRAKQEARQLTAEQVRGRIGRERDASYQAPRYRTGQLLRRALEDDGA